MNPFLSSIISRRLPFYIFHWCGRLNHYLQLFMPILYYYSRISFVHYFVLWSNKLGRMYSRCPLIVGLVTCLATANGMQVKVNFWVLRWVLKRLHVVLLALFYFSHSPWKYFLISIHWKRIKREMEMTEAKLPWNRATPADPQNFK